MGRRKPHQDGKATCHACGLDVPTNGHGLFREHTCSGTGARYLKVDGAPAVVGKGTDVDNATMRANGWSVCPDHLRLVWVLGSYSAQPVCDAKGCDSNVKHGGAPGAWRYQGKPKAGTPTATPVEAPTAEPDPTDDIPVEPEPMPAQPTRTSTPTVRQESPVNPMNPQTAAALQQLLATLAPTTQVDEDMVRAIVADAVEAKLSERIVTTLVVKDADDGTRVEIDSPHPYLQRVIRLMKAGINVYLWGPAGSGKTTAGMQAAHALGRDSEIDTLDPSTFRSMVQGYMTPTGDPVHTSFTRCYSSGKVYIADECDNAPGHVQTLFNSALANGHAPLAWGNAARSDGFGFVGTGNTPGMPTREFPDRKPMSAAFKDRLYFVHWPLDEASERKWARVGGHGSAIKVPPSREITAQAWVDYVQKLRDWARTNAPTLMITPRASLVGIEALKLGESPEMVADALIFRGADAELRAKALNAVVIP